MYYAITLADSFVLAKQNESIHSEYASANLLNSEINTEFIMNDQSKTITLTQGYEAIVDAEDYEELNKFQWYWGTKGYAVRGGGGRYGKQKKIYMHRAINNTPNELYTDHINHNKLDNRKKNLRTVTPQQNSMNRLSHKNSTSKYKGVSWNKGKHKWQASIKINYKSKGLGSFIDEEEASRAYNKAAEELFGEYAKVVAL